MNEQAMDAEGSGNINDQIGYEIGETIRTTTPINERIKHFLKAEELILKCESDSLLDNFFEEMTNLSFEYDTKIRCLAVSFIEKACKKDSEIFLRAIDKLKLIILNVTSPQTKNVFVQKRVIITCTQLYPVILKWAARKKPTDSVARSSWEAFCMLKDKIMQGIDSDNEGIRTLVFKFLEAVILCQTSKTEFSEPSKNPYQMSLDEISRDSFISYRQLAAEATFCFNSLLDQMSSAHIASLNLITVIACCCNIARQRPELFAKVIGSFESLHVNLPPTLSSSQVKSVRKELKNHLLRMLKHPATYSNHHRLSQLLLDLGASQGDIQRAMPAPGQISEALKKQVAAATAAAQAAAHSVAGSSESSVATTSGAHQQPQRSRTMEDTDLREVKRLKLDDDDENDATTELLKELDDLESVTTATQKAIDITTNWILERLSLSVVTKLVLISLYTLPDEMPSAFASSYTPFHGTGSEEQRQRLARMMSILLTKNREGPGYQHIQSERQRLYMEKQTARSEGAIIPSASVHEGAGTSSTQRIPQKSESKDEKFLHPQPPQKKINPKSFNLFTITRQLLAPEAHDMIIRAFTRILNNEKRSIQGGAILAQHKIIVRLVTRYRLQGVTSELEKALLNFIIDDQRNRTDLALLWLAELYAQIMGFSSCIISGQNQLTETEKRTRYDSCMSNLLRVLYDRGEHKETLFHRIFLEAPLITISSLKILRKACLDKLYGAFAMTTLRELILTRARQRQELLTLLLEFSYYERVDIREHSVRTAKELYEISYVRSDVRQYVIEMSESLVKPYPPVELLLAHGRIDRKTVEEMAAAGNDESEADLGIAWDDSLVRAGIHLFVTLLSIDHSLLHQLASICARASVEVTRVIFRCIDAAIKAIGMQSEELLSMIEKCPESQTSAKGAETLVARIVSLLTEREPPSTALVERVRTLHKTRNTDIRSLIPVLNGLTKDELLSLIPKFVLEPKYTKSVPTFFKKIIFGKHIQTQEPLISPIEFDNNLHNELTYFIRLLVVLHRIKTANVKEKDLDILLVDRDGEFRFTKDVYANAIEELFSDQKPPDLLLEHSLEKIRDNHPALTGFISNITSKMILAQKQSDFSPIYVHFGLEGDANSLFEFDILQNEHKLNFLLIGTNSTSCFLFSLDHFKMITRVYDEPPDSYGKSRQIMAIGKWPFIQRQGSQSIIPEDTPPGIDEETPMEVDQDSSDASLNAQFWVHFRGSDISLFECTHFQNLDPTSSENTDTDKLKFTLLRNVATTSHYGFCQTIDDSRNKRLLIPDNEGSDNVIRIHYQNGGEKMFVLSEDYLTKSFIKRQSDGGGGLPKGHPGLFKGQLMAFQCIPSTAEVGDLVILAFEDSTIGVFNLRTKEVLDCFKHPKRHEFLCWSVLQRSENIEESTTIDILVSVMGQVYMASYSPASSHNRIQSECVVKKCIGNVNCGSVDSCLSPSDDATIVACGLTNGFIEGYKVIRSRLSTFQQKGSTAIAEKIFQIEFHDHSIKCIKWLKTSEKENTDQKQENQNNHKNLCAASSDGKLSFYKISI